MVPHSLQREMLEKLHSGHQEVTKCRQRAKASVWWPGSSKQLEEFVTNCSTCAQSRFQPAEPLITSAFPEHPWQRIAADLFEWKQQNYLLIVDYYSRFIEIAKLTTTTAEQVIRHLKSNFARHGIPVEVITDNGPSFWQSCLKFLQVPMVSFTKQAAQHSHKVMGKLKEPFKQSREC